MVLKYWKSCITLNLTDKSPTAVKDKRYEPYLQAVIPLFSLSFFDFLFFNFLFFYFPILVNLLFSYGKQSFLSCQALPFIFFFQDTSGILFVIFFAYLKIKIRFVIFFMYLKTKIRLIIFFMYLKITLRMITGRTNFRCFYSHDNMPAVPTFPHLHFALFKYSSSFYIL